MTENYSNWIGRRIEEEEILSASPAQRLASTLDITDAAFLEGSALPPLWHWLYFLPAAPQSDLSEDGHPRRGDFLPPVTLPRRMFAGATLKFPAPLLIGTRARREGEVIDVVQKEGRTGPLVFVKVKYTLSAQGRVCVEEVQDIVYRDIGPPAPAPVAKPFAPLPEGIWAETVTPDPVLLFRFSALTFNAHRIHYDRPYAMTVEGYPGLVVHGPLLAILLANLVRKTQQERMAEFSFRAEAPIFDTAPFRLSASRANMTLSLMAERADGVPAMRATATLVV